MIKCSKCGWIWSKVVYPRLILHDMSQPYHTKGMPYHSDQTQRSCYGGTVIGNDDFLDWVMEVRSGNVLP